MQLSPEMFLDQNLGIKIVEPRGEGNSSRSGTCCSGPSGFSPRFPWSPTLRSALKPLQGCSVGALVWAEGERRPAGRPWHIGARFNTDSNGLCWQGVETGSSVGQAAGVRSRVYRRAPAGCRPQGVRAAGRAALCPGSARPGPSGPAPGWGAAQFPGGCRCPAL